MHRIDEPHPFSLETATLHYAEERPVRARQLALDVTLDFARRALSGTATHTLEVVRPVRRLTFDAVDLDIEAVEVDGRPAAFDASSAQRVVVTLPRVKAGDALVVKLRYRCTPSRGLYFVGPDAAYPDRPRQAWTQGQDIDSRHWFPCLDTPAQKCSSEVRATFPREMTALSNGALVKDSVRGARRTMHYRLDAPHSPYLVTLVVGQFEAHVTKSGTTSLRTLFPPGRKDDALRCTARTGKMLELFERITGRPYPFGDYAQVFVSEFIFGGMENTSATTLTDAVLHDARAHLDYSAEFLIVHELAHQWFGDLLTCRDWPHGWLNEGFATWAEVLWKEESESRDEADHQRLLDLEAYLDEVGDRYARPIVARSFDAPIDLFDRHLYEKGGLVLHELRTRLGDEAFFAAVRAYVEAHAHGSVETVDLARAIERTSGRNVDRFFDEYVHRAGHPTLEVELSHDAEAKSVRVAVRQADAAHTWTLTLPITLVVGDRSTRHELEVTGKEHVFHLPAVREPRQCVVDAHGDLLAVLKVKKPAGWWREELLHAEVARARTAAARGLVEHPGAATVAALSRALRTEGGFWGARAECAKALGKLQGPGAREALLGALKVRHPKVRRAVVEALGAFVDDAQVGAALLELCRAGDASVFVEAEAARALGKVHPAGAFAVLEKMLARPAFQDVIRSGALDGLAALKDAKAWPLLVEATKPGQPPFARRAAVGALARLAEFVEKKSEAVERIGRLLRDDSFRVRLAAIAAAQTLGDERLVGPLTSTPFLDGREQRLAREAVRTLRAKHPPKELAALRAELEKLKGELRALQEKSGRRR
jgi:aminopeptidase N